MLYTIELGAPYNCEYSVEIDQRQIIQGTVEYQLKRACQELFRKNKVTIPFEAEAEPLTMKVFRHVVKDGKLVKDYWTKISEVPPRARLTNEQFESEQAKAMEDIPTDFHAFIRQNAWEQGHSSGLEEVLNYVRELVDTLGPAIATHDKNNGVR